MHGIEHWPPWLNPAGFATLSYQTCRQSQCWTYYLCLGRWDSSRFMARGRARLLVQDGEGVQQAVAEALHQPQPALLAVQCAHLHKEIFQLTCMHPLLATMHSTSSLAKQHDADPAIVHVRLLKPAALSLGLAAGQRCKERAELCERG